MEIMLMFVIGFLVFKIITDGNKSEMNKANIRKQQKFTDKKSDKDLFLKYAGETNQSPESLWLYLIKQSNTDQTMQEFIDSEKLDYKLYGLLMRDINDREYHMKKKQKKQKNDPNIRNNIYD